MEIFVVHYQNISNYPPLQNFLNELQSRNISFKCLTTGKKNDNINLENILISPYSHIGFFIRTFFSLVLYRPKKIIYFETYSSLGVFVYMLFFKKWTKLKVLVHYHEYETIYERNCVSLYYKLLSKIEVHLLLPKASWISHTNNDRRNFFLNDYPHIIPDKCHVIQNIPSKNWNQCTPKQRDKNLFRQRKLVYVGSLGAESNLLTQFLELVQEYNLQITLDIFSGNIDNKSKEIFEDYHWISIYPFVHYNQLPKLLNEYDCGLILYSGISKNHQFSIPNKFFEYLACGLNVLTSNKLFTLNTYVAENEFEVNDLGSNFFYLNPKKETIVSSELELFELMSFIQGQE